MGKSIQASTFCLFLFTCSCLLYANTLWGGYVWDDRAAIIGNKDVTQQNSIKSLFSNDFWGQDINDNWSHKSYRPITTLSFRLNHAVHGLNASGYHLFNIIIYGISVILFYIVCRQWTSSENSARISSLWFCFHPVHVEAVASLVGRADSLCGLFYMAVLIAYYFSMLRWSSNGPRSSDFLGKLLFVVALVLAVVASLTKEIGVTIFGMIIIMEVAYNIRNVIHLTTPLKGIENHNSIDSTGGVPTTEKVCEVSTPSFIEGLRKCFHGVRCSLMQRFAPSQLRILIVIICLLVLSSLRVKFNGPRALYEWSHLENHINQLPTFKARALSYAQTHFWYFMKLLYPRYLCFDYGYSCIPTIHSFSDPRNALSLFGYGVVGGTIYVAIRWANVPMLIGLALLLIPLIPALNILFPVGTTLAERLLFLPSAGFCILVGELLTNLNSIIKWFLFRRHGNVNRSESIAKSGHFLNVDKQHQQGSIFRNAVKNAYYFTSAVCCLFAIRVVTRNRDWNSEAQIYGSALQVCPLSAKALTNYAVLHMMPGHFHNAAAAAITSVEIFGKQSAAWINAGVAHQRAGLYARAVWYYEQSVHQDRKSLKSLGYLGSALYEYSLQAQVSADKASVTSLRAYAARVLDHSISHGFSPPAMLYSRGALAMDSGDTLAAIQYYQRALALVAQARAIDPDVPHEDLIDEALAYNQLGCLYGSLDNHEEAVRNIDLGLAYRPDEISLLVNKGSSLRALGRLDEARKTLRYALDVEERRGIRPSVAALNNLGLIELVDGRFEHAASIFDRAIKIYDDTRSNIFNGDVSSPVLQLRTSGDNGEGIYELLQSNLQRALAGQPVHPPPARLIF